MKGSANLVSPSGRRCWIGVRVSEYGGCSWYATDDKHIEKYWSDLASDEWSIFVYEAEPGATVYSRIQTTPQQVIDAFADAENDNDEDYGSDFSWTREYQLVCVDTAAKEFPPEIVPQYLPREGSNALYFDWSALDRFKFRLQKK